MALRLTCCLDAVPPTRPHKAATLNKASTVTRTIPVCDADAGALEQAIDKLKRMEPIEYATAAGNNRLCIRYHASCAGFREIERLLDEARVTRPSSLWWRLKSGWYGKSFENHPHLQIPHSSIERVEIRPMGEYGDAIAHWRYFKQR
jgi:hypothetical protein